MPPLTRSKAGRGGSRPGRTEPQFTEPQLKEIGARVETGVGQYVVPTGGIMMWPTATLPSGWLWCDGTTFDATQYPELSAVLGTNVLPNMTGLMPVGVGGGFTLNQTGGAATHALSIGEMPVHDHGGFVGAEGGHDHNTRLEAAYNTGTGGTSSRLTGNQSGPNTFDYVSQTAGNHSHVVSAAGGGGAHNNMPPFRALNFIIKT